MSTCGGSVTTQRITVGPDPVQIVGALDARTRVTVRADPTNPYYIYITATRGARFREGFPLRAGEAYQFEDRGARAELFALSSGADDLSLFVITEGA